MNICSSHRMLLSAVAIVLATGSAVMGQPPTAADSAGGGMAATSATSTSGLPTIPGPDGIGGPISVPAQLRNERVTGPDYRCPEFDERLQPWMDFKSRLADDYRLILGGDVNMLYQGANATLTGNDEAAGSIARFFGDWTLFGEDSESTGSLIFKGEHRSSLGTMIAPADLGFDSGYLGIPGTLFNDNKWFLSSLYWEQLLCDGQVGLVIGRLEPDAFIDVSGYANPYVGFQNLAVTINTTIPLPDVGFGAAGGVAFNDQWTVKAGAYDANGTQTTAGLFNNGSEFFTHVELGWTPSRAERYEKEIHVVGWHVDARRTAGVPESSGVAVTGNWTFDKTWMPFFRAGWSEGLAPLSRRSVTGGIMRYCADRGDLTGVGLAWEDPADRTLREQKSIEVFYKFQIAQNLAVTPSVQFVMDPALNPNRDSLTFLSLRGRITF